MTPLSPEPRQGETLDSATNQQGWIDAPTAKARVREDGILEVRCKPNAVETLESARYDLQLGRTLVGDRAPCPMLLVFGALKNLTREAQHYYSTDPEVPQIVSRLAIVVDSPVSQVLGNIFLGIGRPAMPVKMFTVEAKALVWLKKEKPRSDQSDRSDRSDRSD